MAPNFIRSPNDLVTPIDVTQSGFLQQALRKAKEVNPYINHAKFLLDKLQQSPNPRSLIDIIEIRDDLITAAGFSDKSASYFSASELRDALLKILDEIESEAVIDWRTDIVYRFLLTRGDTLGGTMRNIMGAEAKSKFIEAILYALHSRDISPNLIYSRSNPDKIQEISWSNRILLFDKKPSLIGKNVDVILLRQSSIITSVTALLNQKDNYLVCGEIKGGIDPAGADEHWKTASGALTRIREKFQENQPKLFFVGAAIEDSMAEEIFSQLQTGLLTHAANLNVPQQVSDLSSWLISF